MGQSDTIQLQQRLLTTVRDPTARAQVQALLELSINAAADLRTIDESIFGLYLESGENLVHLINACALIEALAGQALAGARRLAVHLQQQDVSAGPAAATDDAELDLTFDLFGDEPAAQRDGEVAIKDADIDGVVDRLAPQRGRSSREKLDAVLREGEAVGYGLRSQLAEFDRRFAAACARDSYPQALRELDDIRDALSDGVSALLATMFETYVGPVDRSLLMPGHRSALEKALLVRRGLADLRRKINACNLRIQNPAIEAAIQDFAFDNLVQLFEEFLSSEVFLAMRPADRFELMTFNRELAGQARAAARLTCEGLAKYLDSMVAINQRDVLRQHDRELARQIGELLEAAAPLIEVSPRVAAQLVKDAFEQADALFGKHDALDALLMGWRTNPPQLDLVAQIQASIDKLAAQVSSLD